MILTEPTGTRAAAEFTVLGVYRVRAEGAPPARGQRYSLPVGAFFEVRAEFWLDDERLVPADMDRLANRGAAAAVDRSGLLQVDDPERLMARLRMFVQRHRAEFLAAFPDLTPAERRLLGLGEQAAGSIGQIASAQS